MAMAINMLRAYLGSFIPLPQDEKGQGMVEYVMIIGAISIVLVGLFMATNLTGAVTNQVAKLALKINPTP